MQNDYVDDKQLLLNIEKLVNPKTNERFEQILDMYIEQIDEIKKLKKAYDNYDKNEVIHRVNIDVLNEQMIERGFIDDFSSISYEHIEKQNVTKKIQKTVRISSIRRSAISRQSIQNKRHGGSLKLNINSAKYKLAKICGLLNTVHPTNTKSPNSRSPNITSPKIKLPNILYDYEISISLAFGNVDLLTFHTNYDYYWTENGSNNNHAGELKQFERDYRTKKLTLKVIDSKIIETNAFPLIYESTDFQKLESKRSIHIQEIIKDILFVNRLVNFDVTCLQLFAKHSFLVFPELSLLTENSEYKDLETFVIQKVIINNEYIPPYDYYKPVQFRQFSRETCWAASTLNALGLLEANNILSNDISWKMCKDTLDVNGFARDILIDSSKNVQNYSMQKGYNPFYVWSRKNNFGLSNHHKCKVRIYKLSDLIKSMCLTLFSFDRVENFEMNIVNFNKIMCDNENEYKKENEVCIISLSLKIACTHLITIHKTKHGYEIHDSNLTFVHTNVEKYLNEVIFWFPYWKNNLMEISKLISIYF